jgi:hypothetical protein
VYELTEAGAYAGEGGIHLAAQERKDQNDHDSDEYENESILYQALAFLLQLIELGAHEILPPFLRDS